LNGGKKFNIDKFTNQLKCLSNCRLRATAEVVLRGQVRQIPAPYLFYAQAGGFVAENKRKAAFQKKAAF